MVLAIASREGDRAIHAVREAVPPFSPSSVVTEFAELLSSQTGDWRPLCEQFHNAGITYVVADQNTSEIYQAFLPLLNSGRAELLDIPKLRNQLIALEGRTSRGGARHDRTSSRWERRRCERCMRRTRRGHVVRYTA